MSDAYRTSGLPCPHCPNASLRTFANRYICDECNGLLLGFEDFESSLHDLTGEHPNPRYDYGAKSESKCPRCERGFVAVAIVLELERKTIALGEPFLRCERDGLWCPGGVLERVFEKVSRQIPRSATVGRLGQIGPDGLPEVRFATVVAPQRRPRPAIARVDPYGGRTLICPVCRDEPLGFAADRWTCVRCNGALVGNAALVEMVQNISGAYYELPAITAVTSDRACPVCASALTTQILEGVPVDRCAEHGFWFAADTLAAALKSTTEDRRSWFARLLKPRR